AAFVPAVIGAPFVRPGYYERLRKPAWAPPKEAFGPVWTVLYGLIGTAAWLVSRRARAGGALRLWALQLVLNAAWTPLFFGARARGAALIEIVIMWAAIVATTVAFLSRRTLAGVLMLPYLAWVTFATALTYEVWRRND
ncbi:MAG TPA: TspO/MBR family protein, partial [Candidatus Limnocylindria bacterium]|nr:TspO/MBR family protein [Candidatus Limnocylindria bacterium]